MLTGFSFLREFSQVMVFQKILPITNKHTSEVIVLIWLIMNIGFERATLSLNLKKALLNT